MPDLSAYLPTDKVAAGGVTGAAVVLIVGVLALFGVAVPATVVAAAVVIISFAASWLKTETKTKGVA